MMRGRPVLVGILCLALLASPGGPTVAAELTDLPPGLPSSFWGTVTIPDLVPTADATLRVYLDDEDGVLDLEDTQVANAPLQDLGGEMGWAYTVNVPADPCTEGDELLFELSQPPTAADSTLAIDEDSGSTPVTLDATKGLGIVTLVSGPVWQAGTNTRMNLTAWAPYALTVAVTTPPSGGQAAVSDGTISYTPDADYCGSDAFTYRVTDREGRTASAQVSVTITCINDAPSGISLSNATVAEGLDPGAVVGTLSATDPDDHDTHTFTLVPPDTGDNAVFQIVDQELRTATTLNHSTQASYDITVRATDLSGAHIEQSFTITVLEVNHPPTEISLSPSSVAENAPIGTTVGTLSTTDEDMEDDHTYTLVAGDGDADNASFTISGSTLQTAVVLDYETQSTYSVRIQTDDGHPDGTFEEALTITVLDVNERPVVSAVPDQTITQTGAFQPIDLSQYGSDEDAGDSITWSASGHTNLEVAIDGATATITVGSAGWDGVEEITFTATDSGNLSASTTAEFRVLARQEIPLVAGWNLIGPSLLPEDDATEEVLASIEGKYDLVYAWDAATNGWLLYDVEMGEMYSELIRLARGQGLWVHVTEGATLLHDGRAEGETQIPVGEDGWHLIAFATGVAEALPGALDDNGLEEAYSLVFAYDAADTADPWKVYDPEADAWANDLTALEPGRGYWLRTGEGQSGTWTIAYERPTP